jgi:hypothetical protein
VGVRFVALRRLRVGDGYREPGEEVPEAADWRSLSAYVNTGHIAVIAEEGSEAVDIQRGRAGGEHQATGATSGTGGGLQWG